ncbi:hypothetical protein TPA0910_44330 [Streptomyces hygroscopicus subsp. sporocinereus]|uniref:Uncharacterized protein n=1 Tax=Streptomyces hygroscopicus TaxID=1912 RepID=A0ABQ3U315_STRHY|nr:hypothetical protein TPA0910_44330 [Streptomyces hygroscopicus]
MESWPDSPVLTGVSPLHADTGALFVVAAAVRRHGGGVSVGSTAVTRCCGHLLSPAGCLFYSAGGGYQVGFALAGRTITLRLNGHLVHAIADNALTGTSSCLLVPTDRLG